MEENVGLSSPWEGIHHLLSALFADDDDIEIGEAIDEEYNLDVIVYDYDKYRALNRILRKDFPFGNVTLKINLQCAVDEEEVKASDDLETVFKGNPFFSRIESITDQAGYEHVFCVFSKTVLQYFNDNLTEPHGFESHLVQDIAPEIFDIKDVVNYCTDTNNVDNSEEAEG